GAWPRGRLDPCPGKPCSNRHPARAPGPCLRARQGGRALSPIDLGMIPQLRKNCAVFSCTEEETAYWRGILKGARRGRVTTLESTVGLRAVFSCTEEETARKPRDSPA